MVSELTGMRASDRDRQEVVDRLRAGLEDGRLTMEEYVDRMGRAYQAVTYGDLAPLSADLPAANPVAAPRRPEVPAALQACAAGAAGPRGRVTDSRPRGPVRRWRGAWPVAGKGSGRDEPCGGHRDDGAYRDVSRAAAGGWRP